MLLATCSGCWSFLISQALSLMAFPKHDAIQDGMLNIQFRHNVCDIRIVSPFDPVLFLLSRDRISNVVFSAPLIPSHVLFSRF